ncbi:hypothetical protein ABIE13_002015 [Ottowia thiooxydans]|uniref:Uncharacterized protein n=1 Tax=Ottowia thiooxydans TaxID=219182 RepID=A0ABV2Q7A0_9BURK
MNFVFQRFQNTAVSRISPSGEASNYGVHFPQSTQVKEINR